MTQQAFHFNASRCTGCRTCQLACADYHDLSCEHWYRKVYEYGDGTWTRSGEGWVTDCFTYHVSVACNHCDDPACVKACPTGAMRKDGEAGLVSVDADRCIGCGYCAMACPYGNPTIDRAKGHSVKCNGCAERVAEGKLPICVQSCPLHALDFGPVDEMRELGEQADIAPLPSKSYTHPNLYIAATRHAQPSTLPDQDAAAGGVLNPTEVE